MTSKTAKIVFWLGTLSSALVFLWLTYDFHQQQPKFVKIEQISEQVIAGKKAWHKYNCNDCHTILGFGAYYAPDMTKAFFRLGENGIVSAVLNPEKLYKDSFRKMPNLGVTKEEAVNLAAFFKWVGTIENRKWPPQDEKFVKAFKQREAGVQESDKSALIIGACGGCHSIDKKQEGMGGDFRKIAGRIKYDRETLTKFILDPQSVKTTSAMPPQDIPREKAAELADFILNLKSGKEVQK